MEEEQYWSLGSFVRSMRIIFREFGILQLGCSFADRHLLSAKVTNIYYYSFPFCFPKSSEEEDSVANPTNLSNSYLICAVTQI